jgi:tRNA-modifying protein YgfZ
MIPSGGIPEPALDLEYRAAGRGSVLIDRSDLGRLRVRGRDALDLLHRLTTNHLKALLPGEGASAVFTTAKGRILDLVIVHRLADSLLCLTGAGRAGTIREWIERYTFREEVTTEDQTKSLATLGLFGAGAGRAVAALCGEEAAARPLHFTAEVRVGGTEALLARTWPLAGGGFHFTTDAGSVEDLRDRVLALGEDVVAAGRECFELLRIEAGRPAAGRELTEDYNPWEARLDEAISLNKGCYVGQEVIARLHTYDKVSKRLMRLRIAAGAPPSTPATLRRGGEAIGTLTSAALVPGDGVVALGYVRDEEAIEGSGIEVDGVTKDRATILDAAR